MPTTKTRANAAKRRVGIGHLLWLRRETFAYQSQRFNTIRVLPRIAILVIVANEALINESFDLTRRFYLSQARKWTQHPYALDLMWDASVDALLYAIPTYDPDRGTTLKWYICDTTVKMWRTALRSMRSEKRDPRRERRISPTIEAPRDNGQNIIDGRDFWIEAAKQLSPRRSRAVQKWMNGEGEAEIARSEGVTQQAVSSRLTLAFKELHEVAV